MNLDSGIWETVACRIQNPEIFGICGKKLSGICNPQSVILGFGIRNTAQGNWNPSKDWNQNLISTFWNPVHMESKVHVVESRIQESSWIPYTRQYGSSHPF